MRLILRSLTVVGLTFYKHEKKTLNVNDLLGSHQSKDTSQYFYKNSAATDDSKRESRQALKGATEIHSSVKVYYFMQMKEKKQQSSRCSFLIKLQG